MNAESFKPDSFSKPLSNLAGALADKGTPGLILLGIIIILVWLPAILAVYYFFSNLDGDFKSLPHWYAVLACSVCVILLMVALRITLKLLESIVPIIVAESSNKATMPAAFGGRTVTLDGGIALQRLGNIRAERRISKIVETLRVQAADLMSIEISKVRANIMVKDQGPWLRIARKFAKNLQDDREMEIRIRNGHFSSGTCFAYAQPVLSSREDGWNHPPDKEGMQKEMSQYLGIAVEELATLGPEFIEEKLIQPAVEELDKANKELKWIVSMPILVQVEPYKLVAGVLNIDGFEPPRPFRDQLKILLPDIAVGAGLIGVIAKGSDVIEGEFSKCKADVSSFRDTGMLFDEYLIPPDDFDPADCPEPSDRFLKKLSEIRGLEFLKHVTPAEVSSFIRTELG